MNLKEAICDIPLYRELYGYLLSNVSLDTLSSFPELSKSDVVKGFPQNFMSQQLKEAFASQNFELTTTSGTTSDRMQIIRPKDWWSKEEDRIFKALSSYYHNYSNRNSKAILTTAICSNTLCYTQTPPYEKRIVDGILHLNISPDPNSWTKEDIERMILEIETFKPQCLQADPIYLALFIKLVQKYNLKKPSWNPYLISLTYEYPTYYSQRTIKKFWDCPLAILYGSTESGFTFFLGPDGHFHWIQEGTFIRFKPLRNNLYTILLTSLRNPYMPYVNYNTHDLVSLDKPNTVLQFMGRDSDCINNLSVGEIDNALGKLDNNILIYTFDHGGVFRYTTLNDEVLTPCEQNSIASTFSQKLTFSLEKAIRPSPSGKFQIIKKEVL